MSRSATLCTRPAREPERELAPHERRHVVADDAVEDAAGALRVVEVLVELARVGDAVLDPLLRDLVELDALADALRLLELLGDVPRDGLALAIGVGREQDFVGALGGGLQLLEDLLLAGDDLVRLLKAVLDVDPIFLGRSLMCPFDATTSYLAPRYFLIVFAFAGDSTITSVFPITRRKRTCRTPVRERSPLRRRAG
jgi:hypothetical protein